jgi:hypothetical protein
MATERIEAQVVTSVDQASLKHSQEEIKRLATPQALKLSMDVSDARLKLADLRAEYKKLDSDMKKTSTGRAL